MSIGNSKQLLDFLLEGGRLEPGDVESLIGQVAKEDLYLDYKSGKQPAEKLKHTIRKWVTGFANADGGTLALGVSERNPESDEARSVVGIGVPGGGDADDWATRILSPLAGRFSPPPRLTLTKHPSGDVLFIASLRAPQLISYAESNEPRYSLRIGDSTVDVPPYLLSDLLLGRRNHPIIDMRGVDVLVSRPESREIRPLCSVILDNVGFVTGEEIEIGVISWSFLDQSQEHNPHLLQYVDRTDEPAAWPDARGRAWKIARATCRSPRGTAPTIQPFESVRTSPVFIGSFPHYGAGFACTVTFALYVIPRGSMPQWYEITCRYRSVMEVGSLNTVMEGDASFERLLNRKPVLRWSNG